MSLGGVCWWCHWGWPEQIHSIYRAALEKLEGYSDPLHYGPAHVVWDDENFDLAQSCLDDFEQYAQRLDDSEKAIVRESLEQLLLVPQEFKEWPADYDGDHPENSPPPAHWVMKKRRDP